MAEVVYYARFEAGFESFPAENYVDYMTNVMPVPERHIFYVPRRGVVIICEVRRNDEGDRVLIWSLRKHDTLPAYTSEIWVDENKIDDAIDCLNGFDSPRVCDACDEDLGALLRFY
jgi:hypothetical protein